MHVFNNELLDIPLLSYSLSKLTTYFVLTFCFFLIWILSCSSTLIRIDFPFFVWISLVSLSKTVWLIHGAHFWTPYSFPLMCLCFHYYHTILIIVALYKVLKSKVRSSNFGPFQDSFNYLLSFAFPNTFKSYHITF